MFLKMDQNWFYLIEQASDISKIKLSFINYACCLNKTTKTINKLTNEQPSSHFFLTDPLSSSEEPAKNHDSPNGRSCWTFWQLLMSKNLMEVRGCLYICCQYINKYRGVHQMRPFCRHSFIIIIIIVVVVIVVVGHSKSFQPQKPRFSSFENNTG